jgi:hypothetical protein
LIEIKIVRYDARKTAKTCLKYGVILLTGAAAILAGIKLFFNLASDNWAQSHLGLVKTLIDLCVFCFVAAGFGAAYLIVGIVAFAVSLTKRI